MSQPTEGQFEKMAKQEEQKLNKKIEAYLWKAGYAASKPRGQLGMSEGYVVSWPIIDCHTNGGLEKRIQILNKYKDVIQEYGIIADIFEVHLGYPRIILGFHAIDDDDVSTYAW